MWNIFKVNNKDTRTKPCSSVSIVNSEPATVAGKLIIEVSIDIIPCYNFYDCTQINNANFAPVTWMFCEKAIDFISQKSKANL